MYMYSEGLTYGSMCVVSKRLKSSPKTKISLCAKGINGPAHHCPKAAEKMTYQYHENWAKGSNVMKAGAVMKFCHDQSL